MKSVRYIFPAILLVASLVILPVSEVQARDLTLLEAFDIAVNHSSRGEIVRGNEEVARQNYNAQRIGFLLPKISINSSLPAYDVNESYRFFGGSSTKSLYKTTDFDFQSYIELKQSLITGGDLTFTANLIRNDAEYPNTSPTESGRIEELTNQGFFDLRFVQPLLKPSDPKFELNNKRDDMELAVLTAHIATGSLKKEVTEAFLGMLELSLKMSIADDRVKSAGLKSAIDSIKFQDGVVAEEDWLGTASELLDAELEQFDISNQLEGKKRKLRQLLEIENEVEISLALPEAGQPLSEQDKTKLKSNWEESIPLKEAQHKFAKQKRSADYAASSRGISGNLTATYKAGRGTVATESVNRNLTDDIETNSWGVALNITYPLWDGGSSGAAVKAARLSAEQSRLELDGVRKSAQAEIIDLINRVDIGFRKLSVMEKQIKLSKSRMDIAQFRWDDGQISEPDFLAVRILYYEARNKRLNELKKYIIDRIDLDSKYVG